MANYNVTASPATVYPPAAGAPADVVAHGSDHGPLNRFLELFDTAMETAAAGQVPQWNGTAFAPAVIAAGAAAGLDMQTGTVTGLVSTASANVVAAVVFPRAFANVPVVVPIIVNVSALASTARFVAPDTVTTTGFNLNFSRSTTTATDVQWLAISSGASSAQQGGQTFASQYVNPLDFGAKPDLTWADTAAAFTAGATVLTLSSGIVTAAMVTEGRAVVIQAAGVNGDRPYIGRVTASSSGTNLTVSPAIPTGRPAGSRVYIGTDNTTAWQNAMTEWKTNTTVTLGDDHFTRKFQVPAGNFLITGTRLGFPETAATSRVRGTEIVGMGKTVSNIFYAPAGGPTEDPRANTYMVLGNRVDEFTCGNFSVTGLSPQARFCYMFCTAANDGMLSEFGSGAQSGVMWHDIEIDGTWQRFWATGGDIAYNQNSEMKWTNCETRDATKFAGGLVEDSGLFVSVLPYYSQVYVNGSPTAGTWTITVSGQTTTALAYNAATATIQSAVEALSTVGVGNVTIKNTFAGSGYVCIRLTNARAGIDTTLIAVDDTALTGSLSIDRFPPQGIQAVNYTFTTCSFEYAYGNLIRFNKGGCIQVIGGSWIAGINDEGAGTPGQESCLLSLHGTGNAVKHLEVIGTRVELRNNLAKYMDTDWRDASCNIGLANLIIINNATAAKANHEVITFNGTTTQAQAKFDRCEIAGYIGVNLTGATAPPNSNAYLMFEQCYFTSYAFVGGLVAPVPGGTSWLRPTGAQVPRYDVKRCTSNSSATANQSN